MVNGKIIGIDARMIEMSGIGTYIQHLMGHGIYDVAVGNEEEIRRYDSDVKVIPFSAPVYGLKEQLQFPCKAIKEAGVHIMHFPHYNVPVIYNGKYVTTVHDLTHIVLPEFLGNKIKYCYAKFLMSRTLKRAKHIFTVSDNSKKDIHDYFDIKEEKISITYDAIDEDFRVKNRLEIDYLYNKYGIPRDKKLLLYVGNLKPHKNLSILLKALRELNREEVYLLLVGKAFKSVDLNEQEKQMGIKDKVIHTGMVSKEELIDLYNLADLFVFPSLYEGFGIPPLEAMACGTPVIAANNSSIPEVCGDAAVYFDGKNVDELTWDISIMLDSKEKQMELIEHGMKRSKIFDWKRAEAEVINRLYKITKNE